jgi:CheY-like chemotaxis protein
MPGMTGIEFIRAVRSLLDEKQNSIPAIAVTAFGMQHQQAALEGGFQVFLTKPVDPLRVVNEVERQWRLSQVQFQPE